MGSLEKYGRTVFKIISPTDNFEAIKNGITLVARLLRYFPCLHGELNLNVTFQNNTFLNILNENKNTVCILVECRNDPNHHYFTPTVKTKEYTIS